MMAEPAKYTERFKNYIHITKKPDYHLFEIR